MKPNRSKYTPQGPVRIMLEPSSDPTKGIDPLLAGPALLARPDKEVVADVTAAVLDGLPFKDACLSAGILESGFDEWRKLHPNVVALAQMMRARIRRTALVALRDAAERGDWHARVAWLKLVFPEAYGSAAQRKAALRENDEDRLSASPDQPPCEVVETIAPVDCPSQESDSSKPATAASNPNDHPVPQPASTIASHPLSDPSTAPAAALHPSSAPVQAFESSRGEIQNTHANPYRFDSP